MKKYKPEQIVTLLRQGEVPGDHRLVRRRRFEPPRSRWPLPDLVPKYLELQPMV